MDASVKRVQITTTLDQILWEEILLSAASEMQMPRNQIIEEAVTIYLLNNMTKNEFERGVDFTTAKAAV